MSVYSVSNKYLDAYDPFWICRLLSLKIGTVAILLFLFNAFLLQPQSPTMYMMVTIISALAAELIPAPTKFKSIATYIGVDFLLASTIIIFGMFSYFRLTFFLVLIVFSYLALRLMVSSPKVAALPTMMVMYGVMSSGGGATDFNAVANDYLYYFSFGLTGIITILFFPDFGPNVFKSAFIRILESDVANLGNKGYKNSNPLVLTALTIMHSKLPFLPECYTRLYESIIEFQNAFMRHLGLNAEAQLLAKSVLSELSVSVANSVPYVLDGDNVQRLKACSDVAYRMFADLVGGYNQCRA
jgi:hypothetical protein